MPAPETTTIFLLFATPRDKLESVRRAVISEGEASRDIDVIISGKIGRERGEGGRGRGEGRWLKTKEGGNEWHTPIV